MRFQFAPITSRALLFQFIKNRENKSTLFNIYLSSQRNYKSKLIERRKTSRNRSLNLSHLKGVDPFSGEGEIQKCMNAFQSKMKHGINYIKSCDKVLVSADKTSNMYKFSRKEYEKLLTSSSLKRIKKLRTHLKARSIETEKT